MIKVIPASNLREMSEELKQMYIDSFPSNERREWEELQKLVEHPHFNIHQVFIDQKSIGLISIWNLLNFTFIEHFAIEESFQGKGVGSQVIMQIIEGKTTKVVLEVEEPTDEPSRRRITFYERLGFSVCESNYFQPPYAMGKDKVKMLLMSFPDKITALEFTEIKDLLYKEVYQLK
ncbi:MAG TPA: GNAT family N-acetyltransferase [Prolixibacteraceae bacterium]|nr:GNAT family N-acetyltransferase [Prolixibacteraceae bacterium]